ncbi:GPI inositol-deacylase [Brachionichthys hirsutus]|uniref:GPI inositol-deacylase n=1 Tax=Brachionichthys hirsutus TaxID=412623 RepID=UPI0036053A27
MSGARNPSRTMRLAAGAFYGLALGLLALGLRELLTGFEENRCSMTYMFEYPEYRRVALPRRVARQYPAYGLYLYGEGLYAQETRALKLTGAPVLFLPGNAGSYKQARSLGSVALRKAGDVEGGVHFNVFTVDFNEELVALYGGSLRRQTHFLHESIKAILRLYKHLKTPPQSVVLVGHSMGGVVARALYTLPRFNTNLVNLIITQASPHRAPVLALDPYLLEFYSAVREKWVNNAGKLANITVLSVGGGYRDYQVRSGLTALPCLPGDANKLSLVATAVPRTWVSTDHLSIVWCKELVLATVRAFFDLVDPETRQFTENPEKKMPVLNYHFVRHPVRTLAGGRPEGHPGGHPGGPAEAPVFLLDFSDTWSEVNALRLAYATPKEGQVKYFLFALSSRRKAYSHFYCRSDDLEMGGWVYGCVRRSGSSCSQAVDLSTATELLPPYKVLILSLGDLSSVTHLVVSDPGSGPGIRTRGSGPGIRTQDQDQDQDPGSDPGSGPRIRPGIRTQDQDPGSGPKIRTQDQDPGSGPEIRTQDQDPGSGPKIRTRDQDPRSDPGFRTRIRTRDQDPRSEPRPDQI